MTPAALLMLMTTVVGIHAGELNALYRARTGEIGSLCSGLTPEQCRTKIPYIQVHSVVECAIRCTKHPSCKSFNYQLPPTGPRHTHRCEMAPDKIYKINSAAKSVSGYEYYKNVT